MKAATPEIYFVALTSLQPSQLYISQQKLARAQSQYDFSQPKGIVPIPIKNLDGYQVMTDGHTRALAAHLAGCKWVAAVADLDALDWEAYRVCVGWCHADGIYSIADLVNRVVEPDAYQRLWYDRCAAMHTELAQQRRKANS